LPVALNPWPQPSSVMSRMPLKLPNYVRQRVQVCCVLCAVCCVLRAACCVLRAACVHVRVRAVCEVCAWDIPAIMKLTKAVLLHLIITFPPYPANVILFALNVIVLIVALLIKEREKKEKKQKRYDRCLVKHKQHGQESSCR
jgi:hypothetical protein